jgi:hypothetical protein
VVSCHQRLAGQLAAIAWILGEFVRQADRSEVGVVGLEVQGERAGR